MKCMQKKTCHLLEKRPFITVTSNQYKQESQCLGFRVFHLVQNSQIYSKYLRVEKRVAENVRVITTLLYLHKIIYIFATYLHHKFNLKRSLHCTFTFLHLFLNFECCFQIKNIVKMFIFYKIQIDKSTCHRINLIDHVSNQTIFYFQKTSACLPNSTVNTWS